MSSPRPMPRMSAALRFAVVLGVLLLASDAEAQRRRDRPIAEKGDVALIATVRGLEVLRLEPLDSGVGLRYRLADRTVLGTSIGLSLDDRAWEQVREREDGPPASSADEGEDRAYQARLSVWLEQHLGRGRGPISPFVGAGVRATRGTYESTVEGLVETSCPSGGGCPAQSLTRTFERGEVSVGGALLLGAEVKLARGVTLGAAYTLGAQYVTADHAEVREHHQDGQPVRVERSESDETGVSLQTGLSDLTLSIYL